MAVFITGDTHGDFSRFSKKTFPGRKNLTKKDYMIICGDFGGVWNDSAEQRHNLDWLDSLPFTTLFITGNHENYDMLEKFDKSEWHGGIVQYIRPSVLHLTRGQVFEIDGKKFFTMGGASCHDIQDGVLDPDDPLFAIKYRRLNRRGAYFRVNHFSWWEQELPNETEYQTARENLEKNHWSVDYIITHCAPTPIQDLVGNETHTANALTDFLEEISQRCRFQLWFFGHYHQNLMIKDKYILLYGHIAQLEYHSI